MSMQKGNKKMHWLRGYQRDLISAAGAVAELAGKATEATKEKLQEIDESAGISEGVRSAGGRVFEQTQSLDERFGVRDAARSALGYTKEVAGKMVEAGNELAERSGVKDRIVEAGRLTKDVVVEPAKEVIKKAGVDEAVGKVLDRLEQGYGRTREAIKPYFAAEDANELLQNTRQELANITACIMQISSSDSEKLAGQFGSAILAKATGVAATGALLSLVAALGTAGTGTAIASLSGAAATNATLAWVGGLLGGGMATGVVLTGGIGLVVGLGAYKLLGSERREFESLSEMEQRVVQSCWLVMAIIDDYLANPSERFTQKEAELLLVNFFRPLLAELQLHREPICLSLDTKHAVAFRQHVLTDFRRVVIEGFEGFIENSPLKGLASAEYVIGGVFYALLTDTAVGNDVESQLVLDALRRSSSSLSGASEGELGEYLRDLSPDALRGVGVNVKGIYHELLYVHNYNATHSDTYAEVFGATNHPGADIQIKDADTGEVIEELQLKAVIDPAKIEAHLEKYPDISVLATNEVARKVDDPLVGSSGYDNEALRNQVEVDLTAVADNSPFDRGGDAALLAAGVASTRELLEMLRGTRDFPQATVNVLKKTAVASAATVLSAYLFG